MALARHANQDKMSRSISSMPPPPSPSNSTSAASSTQLTTTPSRPRKYYPDSIGRVPLHRRGTSRTYERLEDLLREAGYRETRIVTPETDRTNLSSPTVGAQVVGFLSNLVPSRSSSLRQDNEPIYSPPPSPSLNRTPRPPSTSATQSSTSRPSFNSSSSHAEIRRHQSSDSFASVQAQPAPRRTINKQHAPSASHSSEWVSPLPVAQHHQPTPTRASAYLRHMTSYERSQSTPPLPATFTRLTDGPEDDSILSPTLSQRMPIGWIDNVKRAKEYFAAAPPLPVSGAPTLEQDISNKTRGRLSDRTNAAAPVLTTRLRISKAKRSESQVSISRVVCRSRGSSPVRRDGKGKAREADLDLHGQLELPGHDDRSRFIAGWGTSDTSGQLLSPPRRDVDEDSASDISSDGEEEITLARILVPGINQPPAIERSRSVRSLRRCLELDGHTTNMAPPVPSLPNYTATGSGRWSVSLSWGRAKDQTRTPGGYDDDDNVVWTSSKGVSRRQRGGLPAWAS